MNVICEKCGRKYGINPDLIKNETAKYKCKTCDHINRITKPKPDPVPEEEPEDINLDEIYASEAPAAPKAVSSPVPPVNAQAKAEPKAPGQVLKTQGLGLRPKMISLFVVIPLIAFAGVGAFLLMHMNRFGTDITRETTKSVTQTGEEFIRQTARSVARQCKEYLVSHPELIEKNFMNDADFRNIAIQRVGQTGYTALYSVDPMVLWLHPNRRLIGGPLTESVKGHLGKDLDRWLKIVKDLDRGENSENSGYYLWIDPDGTLREKFMVVTPIEGTRFGITSTIYMEEFLRPIKKVEYQAAQMTSLARSYFIYSLVGALLLIGCIVTVYSYRLANRINIITSHALRISYGDLDAQLDFQSKDELGNLGEAIRLMQNSIRIAIERLRRRR